MRRQNSYFTLYEILLLASLLLQIYSQLATSASTIEYLPGFEGPLPFHLETGYVGVGEPEEVGQLFYYFIESENIPEEDPLMLLLTGGPGCSGLSGIVHEIGPFAFKVEEYKGGVPNLVLRPQTWTKACSIIFVDLPIGTGFSYANSTAPPQQQGDWIFIHHAHQFLRKWLVEHPRFLSNQVYIGGESFTGIPIPVVIQEISNANEMGIQPWINIQGYVLGNPVTTRTESNYKVPFANGMGLVPDELYTSWQKNCKGEYIDVDPRNQLCQRDVNSINELLSVLDCFSILEPSNCYNEMWPNPCDSLHWKYPSRTFHTTLSSPIIMPPLRCKLYSTLLSQYWANNDKVREALHVRKGTIGTWKRCVTTTLPFKSEINSSFEYHVNLSRTGYRSLIYSGDHDSVCPFMSAQAWIRNLNYSIVEDWRPWLVNGQVAGYTRSYSNKMTFATVKGAGHNAPEFKPEECFAMFNRWISKKTL